MPKDIPLYPNAFVGWRSWKIVNGRLVSLTSGFQWAVGKESKAFCDHARHRPPARDCSCGIYALKSLLLLKRSAYFSEDCFGQVSLWGRVLEAEDGYRAEFAYPKNLYVTYMNIRNIEPLSVYGVPVRLMNPYSITKGRK